MDSQEGNIPANNPEMLRTEISDLSTKLAAFSIGFIKSYTSVAAVVPATGGTLVQQQSPQLDLIEGRLLTKETRQEHFGKMELGKNSDKMEKYQRKMVEKYTLMPCIKTNYRINTRTLVLEIKRQPNTEVNGYDYTEDFDGLQEFKHGDDTIRLYYNFKSVSSGNSACKSSGGGSQTRTLRDGVYRFVEDQLKVLLKQNTNPATQTTAGRDIIYFANLLDGDMCHRNMDKYKYLLDLPEYASVKKYVYVGDTAAYCKTWFKSIS